MANELHQTTEIHYTATYNPDVKPTTIHVLLKLAIARGWLIFQIDIINIFLHVFFQEFVFMEQPMSFNCQGIVLLVCKIKKGTLGPK